MNSWQRDGRYAPLRFCSGALVLYRQPGTHLVDAQRTRVTSFQGIVNWGNLANQPTFQRTITGQKRLQAITNYFAVSGILTGSLLGFSYRRRTTDPNLFQADPLSSRQWPIRFSQGAIADGVSGAFSNET